MKLDGMNYNSYAAAVAASCTEHAYPRYRSTPEERASYVSEVLSILFSGSDINICVEPIAYPSQGKTPLLISIGESTKRILWFYPWMTVSSFADELVGLLSDATYTASCVS